MPNKRINSITHQGEVYFRLDRLRNLYERNRDVLKLIDNLQRTVDGVRVIPVKWKKGCGKYELDSDSDIMLIREKDFLEDLVTLRDEHPHFVHGAFMDEIHTKHYSPRSDKMIGAAGPGIYLIRIDSATKLQDPQYCEVPLLNQNRTYEDVDTVFKAGLAVDMDKRLGNHDTSHKKLSNHIKLSTKARYTIPANALDPCEGQMFTILGRCTPQQKRCDKTKCDRHVYDYSMDETHFNGGGNLKKTLGLETTPVEYLLLKSSKDIDNVQEIMKNVAKGFRDYGESTVLMAQLYKENAILREERNKEKDVWREEKESQLNRIERMHKSQQDHEDMVRKDMKDHEDMVRKDMKDHEDMVRKEYKQDMKEMRSELRQEYHEREDKIRHDYEARIETLNSKLMMLEPEQMAYVERKFRECKFT